MELGVIKNDVLTELQAQKYYNEQEITRMVSTDTIPHKERVLHMAELVRVNANIIESIKLLDAYFPAQPAAVAP